MAAISEGDHAELIILLPIAAIRQMSYPLLANGAYYPDVLKVAGHGLQQ